MTGEIKRGSRYKTVFENPKILSKYLAVLGEISRTYDSDDIFRHAHPVTTPEDFRFYKVENLAVIIRDSRNKEVSLNLYQFLNMIHVPPQPKSRAKESPLEEKTADED